MKTLVATVVALSFVAGLAGHADAATYHEEEAPARHVTTVKLSRAYGYRDHDDSVDGYYEHRLDAVRFGSQRWWKIYDEQNGGRHGEGRKLLQVSERRAEQRGIMSDPRHSGCAGACCGPCGAQPMPQASSTRSA